MFTFRLQTLLRLRLAERDQRRADLAKAIRAEQMLRAEDSELERLQSETSDRSRRLRSPGAADVDAMRETHRYQVVLTAQRRQLSSQIAQVEAETERRRLALVEADRQLRVLEKLRQRQAEAYRQEASRREAKQLDETAILGYVYAQEGARMKSAFRWLGALFVAFSIGTVITLTVVSGMLWSKGALTDERFYEMLAALQGIKPPPPPSLAALDPDSEQPSFTQIMQARMQASLDLDLRENAIDKSLGDLRTIEKSLQSESKRLDSWKESFDKRLADLQTAADDSALREVQQTLEAIQPKQAKEQIMKMLQEPKTDVDDPMEDIVRIFKAMPLDKRRKIVAEFETPEEVDKLAEILHVVRLGGSDTELLRDTRSQLQPQPMNP